MNKFSQTRKISLNSHDHLIRQSYFVKDQHFEGTPSDYRIMINHEELLL